MDVCIVGALLGFAVLCIAIVFWTGGGPHGALETLVATFITIVVIAIVAIGLLSFLLAWR